MFLLNNYFDSKVVIVFEKIEQSVSHSLELEIWVLMLTEFLIYDKICFQVCNSAKSLPWRKLIVINEIIINECHIRVVVVTRSRAKTRIWGPTWCSWWTVRARWSRSIHLVTNLVTTGTIVTYIISRKRVSYLVNNCQA